MPEALTQITVAAGEKSLAGYGPPIRGDLRELVISHGRSRSGYVALYRVRADTAVVLPIRHQREAGFQ